MAAKPLLPILATRGSLGIELLQGADGFANKDILMHESSICKVMTFSADGAYIAYCNGQSLKVLNVANGDTIFEVPKQRTAEVFFSSMNTYLATYEAFFTTPQDPKGNNNYEIFNLKTGNLMKSMILKKQFGWAPKWTVDEQLCAKCVSNEIQFYGADELGTATKKLYLQGVSDFSISPGPTPYFVATYCQGKKGNPSFVRLFQYPNFDDGQALANKSFFKADKVDMYWNKKGNAFLILCSVEIDTTGSSYYGEQTLHYMTTRGDSIMVSLDKRGPIYSVDWNSNSSQFALVYGYMPAKATLYNVKCEPVFDYGTGPRNVCKFNPHGNILCLAGFGNLRGGLEMWNVQGKKMLSKLQAEDVTYFDWCPDGEHIIVSTLAPRLKVSNKYAIWHYLGQQKYVFECPQNQEMWQTVWQPQPLHLFPEPRLGSGPVVDKTSKVEAYRPPSARGTKSTMKLHEVELPQNLRNQENASAASLKNKKKREAKAKAKQEQEVNQTSAATVIPNSTLNSEPQSTGDPDKDKKIRGLRKKMKQIEDLKMKQKEGKILEQNQLDKLKSEKDIINELQTLQIS